MHHRILPSKFYQVIIFIELLYHKASISAFSSITILSNYQELANPIIISILVTQIWRGLPAESKSWKNPKSTCSSSSNGTRHWSNPHTTPSFDCRQAPLFSCSWLSTNILMACWKLFLEWESFVVRFIEATGNNWILGLPIGSFSILLLTFKEGSFRISGEINNDFGSDFELGFFFEKNRLWDLECCWLFFGANFFCLGLSEGNIRVGQIMFNSWSSFAIFKVNLLWLLLERFPLIC